MGSVRYVGMDVDAERIAVAVLERGGSEAVEERVIANRPSGVRKYFERVAKENEVQACYEAGCFGFTLHRQLKEMGVECVVAAPGLIPRKPSDRVKTDRRDAHNLARLLRSGDLTAVNVPTESDEAVRDWLRMYDDMKGDLKKAKQRVLHFLLRHGIRYRDSRNWTGKHRAWLKSLELDEPIAQETLAEYLCHISDLEEKCARIKQRIEEIAEGPEYQEPVRALKAFKGVETLIGLSLVTEVGDFRRFSRAEQFMAFLGLVPSEHSSGGKRRVGGITKAGNCHLRKLMIEAAWHYRSYHPTSIRMMKKREGLPQPLITYANRAGRRLARKYQRLVFRGKPSQVAATAVARELCGFLWGAMVGQMD